MPDYGVITEQGFVAGSGLGFSTVSEQESKNIDDSLKKPTKEDKTSK